MLQVEVANDVAQKLHIMYTLVCCIYFCFSQTSGCDRPFFFDNQRRGGVKGNKMARDGMCFELIKVCLRIVSGEILILRTPVGVRCQREVNFEFDWKIYNN